MANHLKMALVHSILTLATQGWSHRRIARELDVDRETVSRHVRLAAVLANPANAPIDSSAHSVDSNAANAPIGSPGRKSDCEPWRELIRAKQDQGLSAKRIHQDLVQEQQAEVSYDSIRRYLKRLGRTRPLPFRRMECEPGDEAQVDFGTGAPVVGPDGKQRRPHVFRIVLAHSRKAYSEASYYQKTEDFVRCLENAFAYFGGVPRKLVIDNLRAAVKQADWFDPELSPSSGRSASTTASSSYRRALTRLGTRGRSSEGSPTSKVTRSKDACSKAWKRKTNFF
ncbi:MAG TPA: DDE-type integrase/transposase/recombinase [Planctomycetaceae bacterium]|nr:DDE-type integrase/transposase/recombinase [Planctomycetaceae bacterium]